MEPTPMIVGINKIVEKIGQKLQIRFYLRNFDNGNGNSFSQGGGEISLNLSRLLCIWAQSCERIIASTLSISEIASKTNHHNSIYREPAS
mmetsp:Transcript_24784/g.49795  ORF Transcript_24784/g.49795 Transcript_24784/m.49795 type:complete len:90 (+) Transcript_24784:678-947(+)